MKLIVITGMDGAGKTTLQKNIFERLEGERKRMLHLPHSNFVHQALKVSGDNSPFGDTWTDRLIFALDNRLVGYELKKLEYECDYVVTQRGWMDSFIFGGVQGYDYRTIADLNKFEDLRTADYTIYLNCAPEVAFKRIVLDPKRDKYETLEYMKRQYEKTRDFYRDLSSDDLLKRYFPESNIYIDTTNLTQAQTLEKALIFLRAQGVVLGKIKV